MGDYISSYSLIVLTPDACFGVDFDLKSGWRRPLYFIPFVLAVKYRNGM